MMAITISYISVLRSIRRVIMTAVVSVLGLGLKTLIAYLLIFGVGGFPELGVRGAAIGTAIGWTFECVLLLILVYALKTPLAAHPISFFQFSRPFAVNVLKTSMPAAINEVLWSLGFSSYYAVYARIGTEAVAAANINATLEELMFVLFIGLGNACSVMVGNKIGEGEKDVAFDYAWRFMIIGVSVAMVGGVIMLSLREGVIGFYPEISAAAADNLRGMILVFALSAWLKMLNFILFIGAMRAGGDTRYAMFVELFSVWGIGVPAALIGGFVLRLPVYGVYALVLLEEAVKAIVIARRFASRKWIHDLVNAPAD
jgi:Na+-driven multidrug efflux pump